MRGRNRWSMAVLGLGLGLGIGWTASPALGDDPWSLQPEQVKSSPGSTWGHHHWRLGSGVCPKCAKISQNSGGAIPPAPAVMPPLVSSSSACANCGSSRNAPGQAAPTTPVLAGDAVPPPPGANRAMPPGFAVVGEPTPSSEPEPIGVMQTNYRQGASTSASPVFPPGLRDDLERLKPAGKRDRRRRSDHGFDPRAYPAKRRQA